MRGGSALVDYTSVLSSASSPGHYYHYDLASRPRGREEDYTSRRNPSYSKGDSEGRETKGRGGGEERTLHLRNLPRHERLRVTIVSTCENGDGGEEGGDQRAFDLPSQAVAQLKELVRSQLRTLLHFPLFRHIVNVNCATAFSYPFLASPPQSSSHLFSSVVTNSPGGTPTHYTVPSPGDPLHSKNVVSTEEFRPSSPQQPLRYEGEKGHSSADRQPRANVRIRGNEDEGGLTSNSRGPVSSSVCADGFSRRTEGAREERSGEGGMKQKGGCESVDSLGIRESRHDGDDVSFKRKSDKDRDQEDTISSLSRDRGEARLSPDSPRVCEKEEENTTKMKENHCISDVYEKNIDVGSGAKEGTRTEDDSREKKSQRHDTGDCHVNIGQGLCCTASYPSLGYRGGKRDDSTLQPGERGKENSHIDNQNAGHLHSSPCIDVHQLSPLEISSSCSPASSFFSSPYSHSHLFTPAVFSTTWDGRKREQLFSRCPGERRNFQKHAAAGEKARDGSLTTGKSRRSSIRKDVIENGEEDHRSCEDSHRLNSSSQSSACPLLLPISLASPPSKLQVLRCMLADTAAATIQRVIRGHLERLRVHDRLAEFREHQRVKRACVKIQSSWRRFKAMEYYYMLQCCELLERERWMAATRIQAYWRMRVQRDKYRIQHLTECLAGLRRLAAIEVQRIWRGSVTRKVLDDEWKKWIIKWPWDKPGTIVEVIGDFSNPPWTKRHLMTYCHVRRCFILPLARKPGRYEIKFIVDGRYVCDGSQTVVADGNGHFNNLIRVRPATKSPFREIRERLQQLQDQNTGGLIYRSVSSPSCSSGMGGGNFLSPHSLEGWAEFMGVGGGVMPSGMHSSSASSSSSTSHHHHYHHHRMGEMISGGSPHEDHRGVPHHRHEGGRSRIVFNDDDESSWAASSSGRGGETSSSPSPSSSSSSPPPVSHSMQCFSDISGQESSLMTSSSHSDEISSSQWNETPNSASWNDWYRGGGIDHKHEEGPFVVEVRDGDPSPHRSVLDISGDMSRHQGGNDGGHTTTDSWPGERRDYRRDHDENAEKTRQPYSSPRGREKQTSEGSNDNRGGVSVKAGWEYEENIRKDEMMTYPQHQQGEGEFGQESIHHRHHHGDALPQGGVFVEKDTGEGRGRGEKRMSTSAEGENQGTRSTASLQGYRTDDETKQHDGIFHEENTTPDVVPTHTQKKNLQKHVEEDTSALNSSTGDTESPRRARVSRGEADSSTQMGKKEGKTEKSLSSSGDDSGTPSGSAHSTEPPVSVGGRIPLDLSSSVTGVSASSAANETTLRDDRNAAPSSRSSSSPEKFGRNREVAQEAGRSDNIFALDRRGYESSSQQRQFPVESRSLGEIGDDVVSSSSSSSSMSPRVAGKGEDVSCGASWGTNTSGSASTRTSFLDRGGVGGLLSPSVMPDQAPTILSSAPASPRSMLEEKREPERSDTVQESTNLLSSAECHGDIQEGAVVDTGSIGPDGAAGVGAVVGERADRIRDSSPSDPKSSVARGRGGGGEDRKEDGRNSRGGKRQARSEAHSVPGKGITDSPGRREDTIDAGLKTATPQVSEVEREVDSSSPGQVSRGSIALRGLASEEKSSLAQPAGSSSAEVQEFAGPGDGGSLPSARPGGAMGGKGGGGGGGRSGKKKSRHRKGKAV
ncbi:iq calmodulin-binding motif domain-containing protein [Cystoisospora suis]|uniref:Iq calmodulin-binding motif domain-containing protein n=1 Tax=Cystoisospora suis TaxID=483139 RepID=A0A2C6KQ00_9APIC|nr:iq calmodulin-binding motif domain-containing protein [Cystoisospora suis]